ncbi:EcsC family protein [Nocardioides litoris]|uniref:EcsC family protein n=1 Tax=Nocardioides litoris TaxID=1926648 RepID=UPI00111E8977|nr:EcsC family protein [Nocardioides litoris]
MGLLSSVTKRGAKLAVPRIGRIAPDQTESFLDKVLARAIAGGGPFDSAVEVADAALADAGGDVDKAVGKLIDSHTRLAGAQGFLTNVGGLVTLAVTIPANVAGIVMVQLRLHAAIAHLHGLDLDDDGVRAALLVTLLGTKATRKLVKDGDLPGDARWLVDNGRGTLPPVEPVERVEPVEPAQPGAGLETAEDRKAPAGSLTRQVTAEVAATLVGMMGGKQLATTVGKRVPLFGGIVGGFADARATRRTGREAAAALPRR